MSLHEIDRGRPLAEAPSNVVTTDNHDSTPRCRLCGHVVWHPTSVVTGLGRDCRREVIRAAREVAA